MPLAPSPLSSSLRSDASFRGGNGASIIHMPLSVTTGPAFALPPCLITGSGEPRVMRIRLMVGTALGAISIGIYFQLESKRGWSVR